MVQNQNGVNQNIILNLHRQYENSVTLSNFHIHPDDDVRDI